MTNIRKLLCLLLALSVILSIALLTVSCGTEDNGESESESESASAPKETESDTDKETESETETEEIKYVYKVTVLDQTGAPVEGVNVQLCTDTGCKLPADTGADGSVSFTYKTPDNYHITLRKDGYNIEAEYHFPEGSTEVTITITALQ